MPVIDGIFPEFHLGSKLTTLFISLLLPGWTSRPAH